MLYGEGGSARSRGGQRGGNVGFGSFRDMSAKLGDVCTEAAPDIALSPRKTRVPDEAQQGERVSCAQGARVRLLGRLVIWPARPIAIHWCRGAWVGDPVACAIDASLPPFHPADLNGFPSWRWRAQRRAQWHANWHPNCGIGRDQGSSRCCMQSLGRRQRHPCWNRDISVVELR
jgi:hypothetical protein